MPFIGGGLVHLLLGGPIIAGATLSRFFALHVFVIPGTLLLFVFLHVWMVLKLGINEWPMPGRLVRRATYIEEYNHLAHEDGIPFVPGAFWKDLIFSGAILAAVAVCAVVFGPFGPSGQPDPSIIQTVPKPDFFFLWIYTILSYLPPQMETPFILIAPICRHRHSAGAAVLRIGGREELASPPGGRARSLHHRRLLGRAHASGNHDAVEPAHERVEQRSDCLSQYLQEATPLVRQGAVVFQAKQCRNCHSIGGAGGERGPALDDVATRMTIDQMRFKVVTGGGNMPAYGKNLSPSEIEALVSFLETLHPANEPPAYDASRRAVETSQSQPEPSVPAASPSDGQRSNP